MSLGTLVKGIHDVTIVSMNVAELRAFYRGLGFEQVVHRGDELAVFAVGANELAIHTSSAASRGSLVVSILVEDLGPVQRRAAELGVPVNGPAELRPGLVGIGLCDPDGNKLEFLRPEA